MNVKRVEPDWTIRPFRLGDAPSARRLIEAVWHEYFHDHPDAFVREFIYPRLSDVDNAETGYVDQALFLCAIAEDEIVGTGAIRRIDDRECEMVRMFVARSAEIAGLQGLSQMNSSASPAMRDTIGYACPATTR